MIRVVEGWRTDERHLMVVDDIILEDAPLEGDSPISKILWGCDPVVDVFGCGLGEQLRGVQLEINDLIGDIQEGHGLIKGYLALSDDAKIVTEKFNNDIRKIIRFSGTIPPQYVVPSIIAPEVYQHLWQLYAKAFEICGVSQINATGTTAEGLTSAVGQRTYQDQQTERFLETVRAYEDFVTRGIAPNIMRCANENMSVRSFVGTRVAKKIQWSSDMATIDAEIRCYPGSMLPDTPAGRMSWGQDMLQLGADPGTVMENIGIQDPDDILRRLMARRFIIQKNIESIVRKGNYVGPEPSDDHKLAMDLVNDAYAEARLDGVPEERKQMLLNYMRSTQGFIDRMAQAAQAAAQSAQPLTQQASQQ
jgi:hypothetical protein